MRKKVIFFVDDDPVFLDVLESMFADSGYEVVTFRHGHEMLKQFYRKPDMVVLDYLLEEDDYETEDLIRAVRKINNKIPVVILSAQQQVNTIYRLYDMGVKHYIVKDASFYQKLDELVKDLLAENHGPAQ
jgi:DNA-binding NtrC family response regulator